MKSSFPKRVKHQFQKSMLQYQWKVRKSCFRKELFINMSTYIHMHTYVKSSLSKHNLQAHFLEWHSTHFGKELFKCWHHRFQKQCLLLNRYTLYTSMPQLILKQCTSTQVGYARSDFNLCFLVGFCYSSKFDGFIGLCSCSSDDTEPTSSTITILEMQIAWLESNKYQCHKSLVWFDLIRTKVRIARTRGTRRDD